MAKSTSPKRMLIILALACISPFVASFALYYLWTPAGGQVNYGTLLEPKALPLSDAELTQVEGAAAPAIRGKWLLVTLDPSSCDERCQTKLYATRQSRTMTGKERERVERLWLVTGDAGAKPADALLAQHPDLMLARPGPSLIAALPADADEAIYIIDPRGYLVLRYPAKPDIRGLFKDLSRLLVASRIG